MKEEIEIEKKTSESFIHPPEIRPISLGINSLLEFPAAFIHK